MSVTGILGKKIGMTQVFDDSGAVHPITVLKVGPCVITQLKTQAKDGYDAAQIGLVEFVKESRLTKPARGHLAKNNLPPVKFMREVPLETDGIAEGDGTAASVKVPRATTAPRRRSRTLPGRSPTTNGRSPRPRSSIRPRSSRRRGTSRAATG